VFDCPNCTTVPCAKHLQTTWAATPRPPQHVIDLLNSVRLTPEMDEAIRKGEQLARDLRRKNPTCGTCHTGCSCHEARRDAEVAQLRTELEAQRTRADNTAVHFGTAYKEAGELRSKLRRFKGWRVRYELRSIVADKWRPGTVGTVGIAWARRQASWMRANPEMYRNVSIRRVYSKRKEGT
jgi:hypothetical protein